MSQNLNPPKKKAKLRFFSRFFLVFFGGLGNPNSLFPTNKPVGPEKTNRLAPQQIRHSRQHDFVDVLALPKSLPNSVNRIRVGALPLKESAIELHTDMDAAVEKWSRTALEQVAAQWREGCCCYLPQRPPPVRNQ